MFLLNIGSGYQNLIKTFQAFLKTCNTICKLYFHDAENFHEVEYITTLNYKIIEVE